ncbi:MAG: U32 family peptidase [Aquabacterium commune]|uniref:ubiquinone anaerobic biosynthesis protein UbiV n=1 Tax=Aquabacterium TaxID=92793 RepID=UPI001D294A67|nr:U32 family peptidase [Aquabacterium sp.]MBT9608605.1 U32 family peptidase [Aquabacterium sp.]
MTLTLTAGAVQYHWPRDTLFRFYTDLADSPAHDVVLGEVVCSRRRDVKPADWLALAAELTQAGKRVWLGTLALIETEAELRGVRQAVERGDVLIEANDAAAVRLAWHAGRPWSIGTHINVYSSEALAEYREMGATRWLAPVELDLDAMQAVLAPHRGHIDAEVFAFGRLPLALSARCFTARHHGLQKDQCGFVCGNDPDGLDVTTQEGQVFLAINGIQTQSGTVQCLLHHLPGLAGAGVSALRLSPCARDFLEVLRLHDAVLRGRLAPGDAEAVLRGLKLPGPLSDGFTHARTPGMAWEAA